jgi:type II restriction enzyme
MDWIRDHYGREYAANSRETIRRFTLHQFVDALLVVQNPAAPDRPINSPKWSYQLHPRALEVVQLFGDSEFTRNLARYLAEAPGLVEKYRAARELDRVPVTLPNGASLALSPGGQNVLIKEVIESFCSCYAPGGEVLYIGDARSNKLFLEEHVLAQLNITVDRHGKLPDLIIYLRDRNWLILVEAVMSHGPMNPQRKTELARTFVNSTAELVYVSCFSDRRELRKYVADIAWGTEVWCADEPTHLIHFNGEQLMGPYPVDM